jgi:hexulose-6-phosphate isomerase
MDQRIGFMQGRLVDRVDGKIQAFPWREWRLEFQRACSIKLTKIEWTLDDYRLADNPLITHDGQKEILDLMHQYGVTIPSLTGDCFMQKPFWKSDLSERSELLEKLELVLHRSSSLGLKFIVIPLVDNGRLESLDQIDILKSGLFRHVNYLRKNRMQIIFETDFPPLEYARFMTQLPSDVFNVNYDVGNSASLGFDPVEEFRAYGNRIANVHIKDRILGGTTVPLGSGSANFDTVFSGLSKLRYNGNFILQTARAKGGDHAEVLLNYAHLVQEHLERHYGS